MWHLLSCFAEPQRPPLPYNTVFYFATRTQKELLMSKVLQNVSWIQFLYLLALTSSSTVTPNHHQIDDSQPHAIFSTVLAFPPVSWTPLHQNYFILLQPQNKFHHVNKLMLEEVDSQRGILTPFLVFKIQWGYSGNLWEKAHSQQCARWIGGSARLEAGY